MTLLPTQNTEFSTRLNDLDNFEDHDRTGGAAPLRTGDAVWANFAASYKVLPTLNVGLNGCYFQQIQIDTVNGDTNPRSKTTNFSLGPGLMYEPNRHDTFFANLSASDRAKYDLRFPPHISLDPRLLKP